MKSILFKLKLKGNGIVNFDHSNQKFIYPKKHHLLHDVGANVKYSKKVFYKDNDGNIDYKIVISDVCINKAVFNNDMVGQNTNFVQHPELLFSQIGSPAMMLNGYLITVKDGNTYKKKSPVTLQRAIQTNDAMSTLEIRTRSGYKVKKDDPDDKSDTTLYSVETVGDVTYESIGNINLNELQFVSIDDYYDRWAFSPDEFPLFEKYIKKQIKSFNSIPSYYKIKDSQNSFPEIGIRFSDEDVNFMVKYYFERLLKMKIFRRNAFVEVDSIQIKYVNNCLVDTYDNHSNWIDIRTLDDINNINVICDEYYERVDQEDGEYFSNFIKKSREDEKKQKKEEKTKKKDTSQEEIYNIKSE